MFEYILRLLILLPLVGGMAWGSLWLWKRVQMGVPLVGGAAKTRAVEMIDVLPLGPGSKLAVVEFAGQRVLIAVSRNGITRIADDSQGVSMRTDRRFWLRAAALAGGAALLCAAPAAWAQAADGLSRAVGEIGGDGRPLSLSLQILVLMSLLTVLPSLLLMMTSFTRIIIVLSILRHALGLQQTPPNQVLVGLSLFLSLFVMAPVITEVNRVAIEPYGQEQIDIGEAVSRSGVALHGFMMKQTRKTDLMMFAKIAKAPTYASPKDVPFSILLPAFVTSELKTAFQIGFLIFLPFLVIDLIVASALMSLGMMMLSPTIISMPFKLLLFVLVDGWALTMGSLASSFVS